MGVEREVRGGSGVFEWVTVLAFGVQREFKGFIGVQGGPVCSMNPSELQGDSKTPFGKHC